MRCFYHADREAVAVCRTCLRGLCAECGVPVGRGLACPGECAEWGRDYSDLMNESVANYQIRARKQKEFEEQKKQAATTLVPSAPTSTARPPGPTIRERAQAHRARAIPQPRSLISSWRLNYGALCLVIGFFLVLGGAFDVDQYLFVLVFGLVLMGFGLFRLGLSQGRRWANTKTISGNDRT